MATLAEIEPTKEAICKHLSGERLMMEITPDDIEVVPYIYDFRNNWGNTYLIIASNKRGGVYGFTDSPVEDTKKITDDTKDSS